MTARPLAVGDRVRVRGSLLTHSGALATVVALEPGTYLPVTIYLDEAREAMGFNADELVRVSDSMSSSGSRAETLGLSRLVTGSAEDRSDAAGLDPRAVAAAVGGRAVPPVPAPADTTTSSAPLPEDQAAVAFPCTTAATSEPRPPVRGTDNRIGAASAHDAAPITDLTALRDAAYRLHDLRDQIDQLLVDEAALAAAVGAGLAIVLGMPSDLTSWGADA